MERNTSSLVETRLPKQASYGILSPATSVVEDHSDTWLGNFVYEIPDAKVQSDVWVIGGSADRTGVSAVYTANQSNYKLYYPFEIRSEVQYSTMGMTAEEVARQAKRALDNVTQKTVEMEFWNGFAAKKLTDTNDNRYLTNGTAVDVTPVPGTGVKLRYAQALLEKALGDVTFGAEGVIHAPVEIASILKLHHNADGSLETSLGNKVVAGVGYSGTSPNGTNPAANTAWMYATGPVTVRLGPVALQTEKVAQNTDNAVNTFAYYADRPAAVTWSTTKLYAVLVDLTLDYA